MSSTFSSSPFYVPVDLGHTALLLADIQTQIAARLPQDDVNAMTDQVLALLNLFRNEIKTRRAQPALASPANPFDNVPLIVHHIFPAGINGNGFISPYNKLYSWFQKLEAAGHFTRDAADPNKPAYQVLDKLVPSGGWGGKDEIIVPKITASCFGSSELVQYLRARGIKHVVLCGLTTVGAVLGTARAGADLDFHMIVPREGTIDDEKEVNYFILDRILSKFVDVVAVDDVKALF